MTVEEIKASVLRGCAFSGQAWGAMSVADPESALAVGAGDVKAAIEAELDSILMALVGNLSLRRDGRFMDRARATLLEHAAIATRQALEAAQVTLH